MVSFSVNPPLIVADKPNPKSVGSFCQHPCTLPHLNLRAFVRFLFVLNTAVAHILKELETKLSENLIYHCLEHTLQVIDAVKSIGAKEGISGRAMELLVTAAAYHDSGFLRTYQQHEEKGCEIADEILPLHGFSPSELSSIQSMIMATKIPQAPTNHLEKILCDADLEYLGGENYDEIAPGLWEELKLHGVELNEEAWLDMQIGFLKSHHYWTDTVIDSRQEGKQRVLEKLVRERDGAN